ncbi:MAG: hypothetical protein P8X88_09005, partial [Gammaproteobacteria bacterium]
RVACDGLAYSTKVISGHEICRKTLMRSTYPFLSPSALLIRAFLIHNRDPFYPGPNLEADVDVLYELLKQHDFAFVPQVLTFVRRHDASATATLAKPLNTLLPQRLVLLRKHGPEFLTKDEYYQEIKFQLKKYYKFLAKSIYKNKNKDFWIFHKNAMQKSGFPLSPIRLHIFWILHNIDKVKNRIEKFLINRLIRSKN